MTSEAKRYLPYTDKPEFGRTPVEILGPVFLTVATAYATSDQRQEKVIGPLSEQVIEKGGDVILNMHENRLSEGKSIFLATAARRLVAA